jgi:hypothetical protein
VRCVATVMKCAGIDAIFAETSATFGETDATRDETNLQDTFISRRFTRTNANQE